jgi:hypothetical protein
VIGAALPSAGVTYYEVPGEHGVKHYRYTVVSAAAAMVACAAVPIANDDGSTGSAPLS